MSVEIGANCEKCGGELNIYQEWDSNNVYVKPCEYCMGELSKEKDALQRKLNIAVEAIILARKELYPIAHNNETRVGYACECLDKALKQLEGE